MRESKRLQNLPPYLFRRIEEKIERATREGKEVISLAIGDPDRPTPAHVVEAMVREVRDPANHSYPTSVGLPEYRAAVAEWYRRRGVEVDPRSEVVALIGSKEGLAHLPFCFLDPGDLALITDPGYPVYRNCTLLAGGEPYLLPLRPENGFLPDLTAVPAEAARRAKLLFLNYPNNPTGAVADLDFFREAVDFARRYDLLICHDAAYADITYDGYRAPSFLEVPGAKEVAVEFGSLSKPYNMTGWRLGWVAGNAEAVSVLGRLKSNLDSGCFQAVQRAGIAALLGPQDCVREACRLYQERRDLVVGALNSMGWNLAGPKASFYVWAPVPRGYTSAEFVEAVFERALVILTPGEEYGPAGQGYFRLSLTVDTERLKLALERMQKALGRVQF
ncbi:MAG: LL-diaminopimelate aminotransferase [Clostridia bacterium]|nr:LL-diaminopimelate aminotransferase [Clostridia bacterium]MDH7572581.1 LL-diaminopimelate aminotransferase [Clostridia bacterium]